MKWLSILKDTTGKIILNTQNAAISAAAAAVLTTTVAYNLGEEHAQQQQVRSITSIEDTNNYEGTTFTADGRRTSIRVSDSQNQVATREERDRMEGRTTGDFGLGAVSGLEGRLTGDAAASTSDTEGLGMGSNASVEIGGAEGSGGGASDSRGSVVVGRGGAGGNGNTGGSGSANGGGNGANGDASAGGSQLSSVSMAHASGNSFNASGGAVAGGSSGGGGSNNGGGRSGERHSFSGSMPGTSSAVPELTNTGTGSAGTRSGVNFTVNKHRNSQIRNGSSGSRDANDMKDIAKRSADAAGNRFRATNEGNRAFFATRSDSGGMSIETNGDSSNQGSADFNTPTDDSLDGINNWKQNADDTADQQTQDRKSLKIFLLATLGAAMVLLPTAAWLLTLSKSPWSSFLKIVGYVLCAAVAGLASYLIYRAADYAAKYHATWFPLISIICGAGVIAGAVFTAIKPETVHNYLVKKFAAIKKMIWNYLGVPVATTVVQTGLNSDK